MPNSTNSTNNTNNPSPLTYEQLQRLVRLSGLTDTQVYSLSREEQCNLYDTLRRDQAAVQPSSPPPRMSRDFDASRFLRSSGQPTRMYFDNVPVAPTATGASRASSTSRANSSSSWKTKTVQQKFGMTSSRAPASAGKSWLELPITVGIELEYEGVPSCSSHPLRDSKFWSATADHSLRNNGIEFISRGPTTGTRLEAAVQEIHQMLQTCPPTVSERCSTHVHVDVRDLTFQQLNTFLACCIVLEPAMFAVHGQGREFNPFCYPVHVNAMFQDTYIKGFSDPKQYAGIELQKYAGISLYRLRDLGTIELRMFNGTTDASTLRDIITLLSKILAFSLTLKEPEDCIDYKQVNTLKGFYEHATGLTCSDDLELHIERGVKTLNDLLVAKEVTAMVQEQTAGIHQSIEELTETLQVLQRGVQ